MSNDDNTREIPTVRAVNSSSQTGRQLRPPRLNRSGKQSRASQKDVSRQKRIQQWYADHAYAYPLIFGCAAYVITAFWLIAGFHLVAYIVLGLVIVGLLYTYVRQVAAEWAINSPTRKQLERKFLNQDSCRIPDRLVGSVISKFYPNPETGKMDEVINILQLPHIWKFIRSLIAPTLLLMVLEIVAILVAVLGSFAHGLGLLMLLSLFHAVSAGLLRAAYESRFHIRTSHRIILLKMPSPWLFWKKFSMPSALITNLDFSDPHNNWWGRKLGYGTLGSDTAANTDKDLNHINYVKNADEFGGGTAELQISMLPNYGNPRQ